MAYGFSPDTSGTLNTNLTAYWNLDETTGDITDSVSSLVLANVNNPGSTTGVVSNARTFVKTSSQYFSVADPSAMSVGNANMSFALWVQVANNTQFNGFIGKWASEGNYEYALYLFGNGGGAASNRFNFHRSTTGAGAGDTSVIASTFGVPTNDVWYFIACGHDASSNQLWISVNNGTVDTVSFTGGVDGSSPFQLGNDNNGNYVNGKMDEVGFWKKKLSAQEITDLYNAGAGNTYKDRVGTVTYDAPFFGANF